MASKMKKKREKSMSLRSMKCWGCCQESGAGLRRCVNQRPRCSIMQTYFLPVLDAALFSSVWIVRYPSFFSNVITALASMSAAPASSLKRMRLRSLPADFRMDLGVVLGMGVPAVGVVLLGSALLTGSSKSDSGKSESGRGVE